MQSVRVLYVVFLGEEIEIEELSLSFSRARFHFVLGPNV